MAFRSTLPLAILILALLSSCQDRSNESVSPLNVIIIFTDDQGYQDLGCYGSPDILTPNLDKMAGEGVKLTSFYSAQAVCSASRAGLLTGCYPNRLDIHGAFMPNSKRGLHRSEVTIADMLKTQGYHTAIFGKWHLGDHPDFMPLQQGFDEYFGIPYSNDMWPLHPQQGPIFDFGPLPLYEDKHIIDTLTDQTLLTKQITERSLDFIKRNKDNPFFLYIAHPQPHVPLFVSDQFKGKSERGLYGDVIMEIDWSTGQILEALKAHGIDSNTLVIYTSDNGPWLNYGEHSGSALPLREGKGTAWEGGQRVPCIIRLPGKLPENLSVSTPMMNIDILPTIAGLTESPLPERKIDGRDLWPLLNASDQGTDLHPYFFYYHRNELHAVRSGPWKMYFPHRYRTLNGRSGGKDGLPVPYDYVTLPHAELYNLETDVEEKHDVIDAHPEVVAALLAIADSARHELGDALLEITGEGVREAGTVEISEGQ